MSRYIFFIVRINYIKYYFTLYIIHTSVAKVNVRRKVNAIELSDYILEHPAYRYANDVVDGRSQAGIYVIKQCQQFLDEIHNEDSKYFFDEDTLEMIDDFLKLVKMPDGHRAKMSAYDSLADFQWFFIANTLAWKHKNNPDKRRYQKSVLLIARKNGKQFA